MIILENFYVTMYFLKVDKALKHAKRLLSVTFQRNVSEFERRASNVLVLVYI